MAIGLGATLGCVASERTKKIPEQPRMAFARNLQLLLDTKYEGNQTKLGKALGISQGHVSALLSGDRGPGLNTLLLMRLELEKSIDEILGFAATPAQDLSNRLVSSVELEVGRMKAEQLEMKRQLEGLQRQKAPPEAESEPVQVKPSEVRTLRRRKAARQ